MSSRSTATGLGDPNITAAVIVDISTEEGMINISSGTTSQTIDGTYYRAGGKLLEIGPVEESNSPNGEGFSINITRSNITLAKEALTAKLADRPVRVRLAVLDRSTSTWNAYDLRQGRVSQAVVGDSDIALECYTPMTIANTVRGFATEWTDDHQRNFVDEDDYIFRFIAESAEKEITF